MAMLISYSDIRLLQHMLLPPFSVACLAWLAFPANHSRHRMEPIIGASRVSKDRRSLLCSICGQPYGACIQCAGSSKCYAAFHPSCARDAGYPMAAVYDEDSESEDEDQEGGSAGTGAGAGQRQQGGKAAAAKGKKARKPKKIRKEGTAAGDNTRLFCFCPKHRQVAAGMGSSLIFQNSASAAPGAAAAGSGLLLSSAGAAAAAAAAASACNSSAAAGSGAAGVAAAGCQGQEVTSPRQAPAAVQLMQGVGTATAAPGWSGLATAGPGVGVMLFGGEEYDTDGSCARSRPADTAVRRGLRAPDALAAALRKRKYVRALPYLVTSCTQVEQLLPPPVSRGRSAGPEFEAEVEQQQQQRLGLTAAAAGCSSNGGEASSGGEPAHGRSRGVSGGRAAAAAALAAAFAAGPLLLPAPGGVLSLADRYQAMKATVASRVASGKSAIHGLGVFAKVPHRAGAGC